MVLSVEELTLMFSFSIDADAAGRYGPALGAAGTTTAAAALGTSYLGPVRGSAVAAFLSLGVGAALHRSGRHPAAAFWFLASGALAGLFSLAYAPIRVLVTRRYQENAAWSADLGGGQRVAVRFGPAAAVRRQDVIEAEYSDA